MFRLNDRNMLRKHVAQHVAAQKQDAQHLRIFIFYLKLQHVE